MTSSTLRRDLHGSVVIPGFHDAHLHFLGAGLNLMSVPIHRAHSRESFTALIAEFSRSVKPGEWIQGGGWDEQHLDFARFPDRDWIDSATRDHPVLLYRHDGHSAVCNSLALEIAGIDRTTPHPAGGIIERDADGEATGLLKDAAILLVDRKQPDPSNAKLDKALGLAQDKLISYGITSVGDMLFDFRLLEYLEETARLGGLKLRLTGYSPILAWDQLLQKIQAGLYESDFFKLGGLKVFSDGSLGSRTALMLQAYHNDPDNVGIYDRDWQDVELVKRILCEADDMGLQVAIHAIGDRANREVLDVLQYISEQKGSRDRRYRIEHAQHVHPEDLARFGTLQAIASVQPAHILDDIPILGDLLGARAGWAYPFRSLLNGSITLALGSDWPVAEPDPVRNIHAAIHRDGFHPEQALTFDEALYAHTAAAAFASFSEGKTGRIRPGLLADMVVLDESFLGLEKMQKAPDNLVSEVFVGGQLVWERDHV